MSIIFSRVRDKANLDKSLELRKKVFVVEQRVSEDRELDEYDNPERLDKDVFHFNVFKDDICISTARIVKEKEVKIQTFKVSLLLELSPQESVLLEQSLVPLALSGFAVSPFGGSTFAVDSIPECLSEDQVEKVVREILDRLALFGKRGQNEEILRDVCQVVSEHASMPYEQELGQSEMDCLLAQWEELDSPMVSIKDLPLLVEFSLQELEKRLRR